MTRILTTLLATTITITGICQGFDASVTINTLDENENPRTQEEVIFTNKETGEETSCITDENGTCKMTVPQGATYQIAYSTWNDQKEYAEYPIPEMDGPLNLTVNITVQGLPEIITLDHVYFDTGKSTLKDESFEELDKLVHFLTVKSHLEVEIAGHTDDVGDAESNMKLSQDRANAVVDYLVEHGIDRGRLKAVGYGETEPVASNDTDTGRAKNRRTEARILH